MSFTTDQTRLIVGWLDNHPEILSDAISWEVSSVRDSLPTVVILGRRGQQLPEGVDWSPAQSFVSHVDGRTVTYREAILHESSDFKVIMHTFGHVPAEQVAS